MPPSIRRFLIYWLPVILYCLFIFLQSAFPSPVSTEGVLLGDKLLHLAGYAVLGALFFRALEASRPRERAWALWALSALFATAYGASDELHQAFVPERSADMLDLAADAAGAMIGAGMAVWAAPRMRRILRKNHGLTNLRSSYK